MSGRTFCLSTHGGSGFAPGSIRLPNGKVRCGVCSAEIEPPLVRPIVGWRATNLWQRVFGGREPIYGEPEPWYPGWMR